jgi:hypothetical protein
METVKTVVTCPEYIEPEVSYAPGFTREHATFSKQGDRTTTPRVHLQEIVCTPQKIRWIYAAYGGFALDIVYEWNAPHEMTRINKRSHFCEYEYVK